MFLELEEDTELQKRRSIVCKFLLEVKGRKNDQISRKDFSFSLVVKGLASPPGFCYNNGDTRINVIYKSHSCILCL